MQRGEEFVNVEGIFLLDKRDRHQREMEGDRECGLKNVTETQLYDETFSPSRSNSYTVLSTSGWWTIIPSLPF